MAIWPSDSSYSKTKRSLYSQTNLFFFLHIRPIGEKNTFKYQTSKCKHASGSVQKIFDMGLIMSWPKGSETDGACCERAEINKHGAKLTPGGWNSQLLFEAFKSAVHARYERTSQLGNDCFQRMISYLCSWNFFKHQSSNTSVTWLWCIRTVPPSTDMAKYDSWYWLRVCALHPVTN